MSSIRVEGSLAHHTCYRHCLTSAASGHKVSPPGSLGSAKQCQQQQPGYADPGQVARPVATVLELRKSSLGHEDLHPSPEGMGSWRRRKSPFWLQAGLEDGSSGTAQSEASVLTAGAACPVLTTAVQ